MFNSAHILYSNIGRHDSSLPDGMRLTNVTVMEGRGSMRMIDAIISNTTHYQAWNHARNCLVGGRVTQINLETPRHDEGLEQREVELRLDFVDPSDDAPVVLPDFMLSFFDFDQNDHAGNGQECISLPANDSTSGLVQIAYLSDPTHGGVLVAPDPAIYGWMRACSKWQGDGQDNLIDPLGMTDEQRAKAIVVIYSGVSSVRFRFSIRRAGWGGRNFLFGGESNAMPPCVDGASLNSPLTDISDALTLGGESWVSISPDDVGTIVAAVIITTVVFSAAASLATAMLGGPGVTGTAYWITGGVGCGAHGALLALVHGSQRFVCYGSLATSLAPMHVSVCASLEWVQGGCGFQIFTWIGSSLRRESTGESTTVNQGGSLPMRGLSETDAPADWLSRGWASGEPGSGDEDRGSAADACSLATDLLVTMLVFLLIVLLTLLTLQSCVYHLWRHRMNRRYYERKHNPKKAIAKLLEDSRKQRCSCKESTKRGSSEGSILSDRSFASKRSSSVSEDSNLVASAAQASRIRFKPFPSAFVFPGLPVIAASLFCTGLVAKSFVMLQCEAVGWRAVAIVILFAILMYGACALAMLLRFHGHFRVLTWKAATYPAEAKKVVDPLYRMVSKLRTRYCRKAFVIDRPMGKFARPSCEIKEPARTERLLANSSAVVHPNASDTLDAYGFALMARSGGMNLGSILFEAIALSANIIIAAITGICIHFEPGSNEANMELFCVLGVQLFVTVYAWWLRPSADRVMNVLVGTQFALEASMTVLLLAETLIVELTFDAKLSAFLLALAAMLAPVVQRFYDAFIVQCSKATRREGFTYQGACFSLLGLVVFLPGMVARLIGLEMAFEGKVAEAAGDDINKMSTKVANEGIITQLDEGLAERVANMLWLKSLEAEQRRKGRDRTVAEAAQVIQKRWRSKKHTIARAKGSTTPRPSPNRSGRGSRQIARESNGPGLLIESPSSGTLQLQQQPFEPRPGFQWLDAQLRNIDRSAEAEMSWSSLHT